MNDREALAKAVKIAAEAFEQSFDKGGSPYILLSKCGRAVE